MSFNMYDLDLDEDTTKKGPSHLSCSFPNVPGLAILRSTKCPGMIFLVSFSCLATWLFQFGIYWCDLLLEVWALLWCLFIFCKCLRPLPKLESLLFLFLLLPVLMLRLRIKSLNGVNPIDLETTVLWFHAVAELYKINAPGHSIKLEG
jgi:hypothetical protein